jgi:putative ABC transport system substrate-binding protein
MKRRDALAVLGALAASPALAQRKERAVVGVLRATAYAGDRDGTNRLVGALKRRGYEEGRNLVVDRAYADGRMDRLPALAREMAARSPDVVVVVGLAAAQAWQATGSRAPVVFFGNFDPLRGGLVKSLARPGGTMTGVLIAAQGTLAAKRLEFLRDAIPSATRIGVLAPEDRNFTNQLDELRRAAQPMGVALTVVEATGGDYERAFRALAAAKVQALFVGGHTFFARDGDRIIALAAKHRLPATFEWPEQAEDGGLMGYGADIDELHDRVAQQIERVLNGASPADLPVEQPTKAELVVNLKTAKALGITIPPALLQRADRLIE